MIEIAKAKKKKNVPSNEEQRYLPNDRISTMSACSFSTLPRTDTRHSTIFSVRFVQLYIIHIWSAHNYDWFCYYFFKAIPNQSETLFSFRISLATAFFKLQKKEMRNES